MRNGKTSDLAIGQKPQHPQKSNVITQTPQKNFDYTTIADRLRTVS